jgi:hypothetical protein
VYIASSVGSMPLMALMEIINDCWKTAEEPWWAINAHHFDVRCYNLQGICPLTWSSVYWASS